jgi:hypothetical protein
MRLVNGLLQARGGKLCVNREAPRTCFVAGLGRRPEVT